MYKNDWEKGNMDISSTRTYCTVVIVYSWCEYYEPADIIMTVTS